MLDIFTKQAYNYIAYSIYGKELNWRIINGAKSVSIQKEFADYMLNKYGAGSGPSFVWLFIIFQFGRFSLTNFKVEGKFANFVTPSMVFSKGSIKKFEERKTIDNLTLRSEWLKRFNISQQDFVKKTGYTFTASMSKVNHKAVERQLMKFKDPIKRVVATTGQGMDLCIELTDLYNETDLSCKICPYAQQCKEMLKQTNYKLYKLRGYR